MTIVPVRKRCFPSKLCAWPSGRSFESASTAETEFESSDADFNIDYHATKRVSFAPTARQKTIRSHKAMSEQRKQQLWLSPQDFVQLRNAGRKSATDACTVDVRYKNACEEVCKCISIITASMDPDAVEILVEDTDFLEHLAENLYKSDDLDYDETFRGLEDMVSAARRFIRFEEGRQTRKMVFDAAEKANETWPDEAARQYREMSLAAVTLARVIAVADEAAAEDVYSQGVVP